MRQGERRFKQPKVVGFKSGPVAREKTLQSDFHAQVSRLNLSKIWKRVP
jgi:hypothetical protein